MISIQRSLAPTLSTERLQLVALEERHFEAFAELHSDPDTMRFIGDGKTLDRIEAWLHLAMLLGHWRLRGYGVWAVEDSLSSNLLGRAGLFHPEGWGEPELNWMIKPSARGQGMATEAAQAVLNYAFDELGFERIISLVRPENAASANVARKLGASLAETIEFMGGPMDVFRYMRKNIAKERKETHAPNRVI